MQVLEVFSVFDSAVGAYIVPFYLKSKGEALRVFTDLVNDKSHGFSRHPEDFTLFHLGSWNDSDASYQPFLTPVSLGKAIEYISDSNVAQVSPS